MIINGILEGCKLLQRVSFGLPIPHIVYTGAKYSINWFLFWLESIFKNRREIPHPGSDHSLDVEVGGSFETGRRPEVDQCAAGEENLAAGRSVDTVVLVADIPPSEYDKC